MPELTTKQSIACPAQRIFDTLIDLHHYGAWLDESGLYGAVQHISDNAVRQGTTYADRGQSTTMQGQVTQVEPPGHLQFTQTAATPLGGLYIEINYRLEVRDGLTQVTRRQVVSGTGALRWLAPLLMGPIKRENARILDCLKAYLE
jgi:uncharacterized protein YndB with AHSA1/START domain